MPKPPPSLNPHNPTTSPNWAALALALILALILCLALLLPSAAHAVEPEDIVMLLEPSLEFDCMEQFHEGLARVRKDDKWGFVDATGKEITPFKYDYAKDFFDGMAAVNIGAEWGYDDSAEGGKWGFIDKTGKEIVPCRYDHLYHYYGLVCIDGTGEIIGYREGMAAVELNGKWGFVNKAGVEVVPCKYDSVKWFVEGMAAVYQVEVGKWGFIDKFGNEVIPLRYNEVENFSDGLAAFRTIDNNNGKWGFIDKSGREAVPATYDYVKSFSEGFAAVNIGYYNKPDAWEDPNWESKWIGGKWGFIDKAGREVVPFIYDYVKSFSKGFAAVNIGSTIKPFSGELYYYGGYWAGGKWGYIDIKGSIVLPVEYEADVNHADLDEGLAMVPGDGYVWGLLDINGNIVSPLEYDGEGLSVEIDWEKLGYIDVGGNNVASLLFDYVMGFSEGYAWVQKDGLWGIIANTKVANIDNPPSYPTVAEYVAEHLAEWEATEAARTAAAHTEAEAEAEAAAEAKVAAAAFTEAEVAAPAETAQAATAATSPQQEEETAGNSLSILILAIIAIVLLAAGGVFVIIRWHKAAIAVVEATKLESPVTLPEEAINNSFDETLRND